MSIRVSSTSLIAGAIVVGNAGHGVLAQQIATTGDYGPGYAYSSLSFPADNGKEIRGLITTQPALGTLFAFEDTSFTFVGPNGTHTFQYQIYVDGVALGSPQTGTINVGGSSTSFGGSAPISDLGASGTFTSSGGGGYVPSTRRMTSASRSKSFTSTSRSRAFTSPGRTET